MEEVSFYTTDNGAAVTISIYTGYNDDPSQSGNIESGTLVHTQPQEYTLAGYHTMKLDKNITLNAGDYFAVVLEAKNDSYKFPIAIEQIGKKIASIQVVQVPELISESNNYEYEHLNELSGRVIKQTVTDNDGKILPEGTVIALNFTYIEEFSETVPGTVSKYGLRDVPYYILDPIYPSVFEPDMYYYDGYVYPAYFALANVDKDGRITINADGTEPVTSDKEIVKLPNGHYDITYVAFSSDSQPLGIVKALRTIEITGESDSGSNNGKNGNNNDSSANNFIGSSGGGCKSGLSLLGLGLAALILGRKN